MNEFQKGRAKTGGRAKGVKNRFSHDFLTALADEFSAGGRQALAIMRIEHPSDFIRACCSVMPKDVQLEITDGRLQEMSDEELEIYLDFAKKQIEHKPAVPVLIDQVPIKDELK